mgnify:CR=1 FL=1
MKREPMRTAEINIFALTEGQFRALCELIGEDSQEMARLDENRYVCGIRGETIPLWSGIRRCGRLMAISSAISSASPTGGTEGPVSSRF